MKSTTTCATLIYTVCYDAVHIILFATISNIYYWADLVRSLSLHSSTRCLLASRERLLAAFLSSACHALGIPPWLFSTADNFHSSFLVWYELQTSCTAIKRDAQCTRACNSHGGFSSVELCKVENHLTSLHHLLHPAMTMSVPSVVSTLVCVSMVSCDTATSSV